MTSSLTSFAPASTHHEAVLAARDDDVERRHLALARSSGDDERAVDVAHADAGQRLLERDAENARAATRR